MGLEQLTIPSNTLAQDHRDVQPGRVFARQRQQLRLAIDSRPERAHPPVRQRQSTHARHGVVLRHNRRTHRRPRVHEQDDGPAQDRPRLARAAGAARLVGIAFPSLCARARQPEVRPVPRGRPAGSRAPDGYLQRVPRSRARSQGSQPADRGLHQGPRRRKGDTLEGIAARYYQNPFVWRAIALANDIDDPLAIDAGVELHIPSLPFRDPETGEVAA